MRRILTVTALILAALFILLGARAMMLTSRQIAVERAPRIEVDAEAAALRLGESLRFRTVSFQDPDRLPASEFEGFHAWLQETYPALHAGLVRERIPGGYSLLYTWPGSDPLLEPVILMAHHDVVPPGPEDGWAHPAFSGEIADGFVWGRGAMDDKGSLVALCEAVERLLQDGFAPTRTVLLSFGHDEEVGGPYGVAAAAELLASRGVRAALVLDEGGAMVKGVVPGVSGRWSLRRRRALTPEEESGRTRAAPLPSVPPGGTR